MRKILLFFLIIQFQLFAGTTGKLAGNVTDAQTGEPLPGSNILIKLRLVTLAMKRFSWKVFRS